MNADSLFAPPAGVSLREFTQLLGNTIRMTTGLQRAWVRAELSDVRYSGGHCYMELIEKNQQGATVAKLRANIWASYLQQLRAKFYKATGRDIVSGMKVLVNGSAIHHDIYGLSFNITDIDPSYTLGDMERLRREILMRLHKEGVLEANKALALPAAPQRIAVVSAAGAAGYGDFINQLESNPEGFVLYPALFPAVMQGDRTSASVCHALDLIEMSIDVWDCVVVIRGGGATSDLNGFDDYELARRVATFPLPILVGIGHERDRTVLDEIANTRLKTPTAVANFLIDRLRDALTHAVDLTDSIASYVAERIHGEKRMLANLEGMLPAVALNVLGNASRQLDNVGARLPIMVKSRLHAESVKLESAARIVASAATSRIGAEREALRSRASIIRSLVPMRLVEARRHLDGLASLLCVLSPENTLKRGYSITTVGGKAVTDASQLRSGDVIETRLMHGTATSVVK